MMPPPARPALVLLLASACAHSVVEQRLVQIPPLSADCNATRIDATVTDTTRLGRFEVVGTVAMSGDELQDPFDPALLEQVRARTCAMGGRLFAIVPAGTEGSGEHRENTFRYAVLRHR